MHTRFAFLLFTALNLCSCRATPPKFEARTQLGSARSDDENVARALADKASAYAPMVCEILDVERESPFIIWHVPGRVNGLTLMEIDSSGRVTGTRIEIGDQALPHLQDYLLAHELAHWYMRDATWARLPLAVEEGLGDAVAFLIVPEMHVLRDEQYADAIAGLTLERRNRVLEISRRDWNQAPREVRDDAYPVGYEIVQRIGIDGLRAMCDRAAIEHLERVPVAWLNLPRLPSNPTQSWARRFKL